MRKGTGGDDRFFCWSRALPAQRLSPRERHNPLSQAQPLPWRDRQPWGRLSQTRRGPRGAPTAAPSTPDGPGGWDPAKSRRDSPPCLVRPARVYRGDVRFESRDSLANSRDSEREQVRGPGSALGGKGGPDPALSSADPAATPPPP